MNGSAWKLSLTSNEMKALVPLLPGWTFLIMIPLAILVDLFTYYMTKMFFMMNATSLIWHPGHGWKVED